MAISGYTRREFTLAIAGSAVLAADQPSSSCGQDSASEKDDSKQSPSSDKKASGKDDPPGKKPASEEPPEPPPEPPPEVAYLIGLIARRYPDERLDEVAVNGIVRDIYGDLARGRVLSSFPLDNSDEPGFVFQAWRAE